MVHLSQRHGGCCHAGLISSLVFFPYPTHIHMNSVKEQLPGLASTYTPVIPTKCIHTQVDIDRFTKTKAFSRLLTFVILLNASVTQKPNSYACHVSEVSVYVESLLVFH